MIIGYDFQLDPHDLLLSLGGGTKDCKMEREGYSSQLHPSNGEFLSGEIIIIISTISGPVRSSGEQRSLQEIFSKILLLGTEPEKPVRQCQCRTTVSFWTVSSQFFYVIFLCQIRHINATFFRITKL